MDEDNLRKISGITLIEILLVLVVMSSIILLVIGFSQQKVDETRRDRAILQYQAILNAGLSYYVNTGKWPGNGTINPSHDLVINGYIPSSGTLTDPWGHPFQTLWDPKNNFYVSTSWPNINATQLARDYYPVMGRLPLGYTASTWAVPGVDTSTTCAVGGTCILTAFVPLPGQNLANARSVNFAGVYKSGACVPAPVCPAGMSPNIFVMPAEVSGVNDPGTLSNVYPISSFSAFARGGEDSGGGPAAPDQVYDCRVETATKAKKPCGSASGWYGVNEEVTPRTGVPEPKAAADTKYWRVCLSVVTEKGRIVWDNSNDAAQNTMQGQQMGSIVAITRCVPNDERPRGHSFKFFEPNHLGLP